MSESNDGITRRCFLDNTARAWLMMSSVGAISVPVSVRGDRALRPARQMPHRYIDQSLCTGCRMCNRLCPMGAISFANDKSSIDANECAECGTCSRAEVCPVDAIRAVSLEWPRTLRGTFSNPLAVHETTGITGRGTEGIKSNDSQNRYRRGDIGVFIELGRTVTGARFVDVERAVKKFKTHGYEVIPGNPIVALIADQSTGALRSDVLNEKIISCVLEFVIPDSAAGELMEMIHELSEEVDCVFSLSVALRADENGSSYFRDLFGPDVFCLPNAKVNIGMAANIG